MPARSDENHALTIDGQTGKPDPTSRTINLYNFRDVRLELAWLYRQIDAEKITSQDVTRRAYVLRTLADVLTLAELEKRIEDLETRRLRPAQSEARTH